MLLRDALLGLWLLTTVFGYVLASYGVLRESFANLARPLGFGEGRFGEGPFGGSLTAAQDRLVRLGVRFRLLPGDRELTPNDRKRNAACAVLGVLLVGLSILLDVVLKGLERWSCPASN